MNIIKTVNRMKHALIIIFALLLTLPLFSQNEKSSETTTYYFIRHAEKNRSDNSNHDPHLLEKGKLRAEHWASVFKNINFDMVYSTDYHRTRETAKPTAIKNNIGLTLYDPREHDVADFLKDTKGKTVLVVGHSNTTPQFVNSLLGKAKYDDIDDNNNANLYIVTISNDAVSDTLLLID